MNSLDPVTIDNIIEHLCKYNNVTKTAKEFNCDPMELYRKFQIGMDVVIDYIIQKIIKFININQVEDKKNQKSFNIHVYMITRHK